MFKLIDAGYNEDSRISYSKVRTPLGNFMAYAKLSNEDKNEGSSYTGCLIAEYRCYILYWRQKIKNINIELQTYYKLLKDFSNEDCGREIIKKRIKQKEQEKQENLQNIRQMKQLINTIPETARAAREKIAKVHEKNKRMK